MKINHEDVSKRSRDLQKILRLYEKIFQTFKPLSKDSNSCNVQLKTTVIQTGTFPQFFYLKDETDFFPLKANDLSEKEVDEYRKLTSEFHTLCLKITPFVPGRFILPELIRCRLWDSLYEDLETYQEKLFQMKNIDIFIWKEYQSLHNRLELTIETIYQSRKKDAKFRATKSQNSIIVTKATKMISIVENAGVSLLKKIFDGKMDENSKWMTTFLNNHIWFLCYKKTLFSFTENEASMVSMSTSIDILKNVDLNSYRNQIFLMKKIRALFNSIFDDILLLVRFTFNYISIDEKVKTNKIAKINSTLLVIVQDLEQMVAFQRKYQIKDIAVPNFNDIFASQLSTLRNKILPSISIFQSIEKNVRSKKLICYFIFFSTRNF